MWIWIYCSLSKNQSTCQPGQWQKRCGLRAARFIFFKKGQTFSKKRSKTSQTFHHNLSPYNSNSHKNTSCASTAPPQKTFNSKLFLEFVTYDRKMPKFYSFSKTFTVNKSTWKINSYFSIITKFWTLQKQSFLQKFWTLQSKQSSLL